MKSTYFLSIIILAVIIFSATKINAQCACPCTPSMDVFLTNNATENGCRGTISVTMSGCPLMGGNGTIHRQEGGMADIPLTLQPNTYYDVPAGHYQVSFNFACSEFCYAVPCPNPAIATGLIQKAVEVTEPACNLSLTSSVTNATSETASDGAIMIETHGNTCTGQGNVTFTDNQTSASTVYQVADNYFIQISNLPKGSYSYSYSYADWLGNNICIVNKSDSVKVCAYNAVPAQPGIITGSKCVSGTKTYSIATVTNATSYNWIVPANSQITGGQGTTTITVDFDDQFTTGDLSVAALNCKGTGAYRSITLNKKPAVPSLISGNATEVCKNTSEPYSVSPVAGVTTYNWSTSINTIAIAAGQGSASIGADFDNAFTKGSIYVTAQNVCGTSKARSLDITSVPDKPGPINGSKDAVCKNTSSNYSIARNK